MSSGTHGASVTDGQPGATTNSRRRRPRRERRRQRSPTYVDTENVESKSITQKFCSPPSGFAYNNSTLSS